MVTAPLMVLVYDRAFLFDSLRQAIGNRWRFYGCLALTWMLLAYLVVPGPRSGSAGFSTPVQPWVYLLNQAPIIVRYLRLVVWPTGLVIDYGPPLPLTIGDVLPYAGALLALAVLGAVALRRKPDAGFLAAWIFITLAPTSSIVPIATQVGAERRMYLPLMAIVALIVTAAYSFGPIRSRLTHKAALGVLAAVAVVLATTTIARTAEYEDELVLAQTVLERWPTDRAHEMVGSELAQRQRDEEAIVHLRIAAKTEVRAQYNLGVSLFNTKHYDEAIDALRTLPVAHPWREEVPWSRRIMGHAHMLQGRWAQALTEFRQVLAMTPGDEQTRRLLISTLERQGIELGTAGRHEEARRAFRAALDLDPKSASLHRNLATALADSGDLAGAAAEARQAIALNPLDASSYNLLGRALAMQGRMNDAVVQLEQAVRISPEPAFRDDLQKVRSLVKR